MAKVNQDFSKWEEDTFKIEVLVEDATIDLSTYQAYWAMGASAGGSASIIKTTTGHFSAQGGITWASADKLEISISKTDTQGLSYGDYYHELTIKDPVGGGSVIISTGTFTLKEPLFPSIYR